MVEVVDSSGGSVVKALHYRLEGHEFRQAAMVGFMSKTQSYPASVVCCFG